VRKDNCSEAERRSSDLCVQGRETAQRCALLAKQFDQQIELNGKLQYMLQTSEAEAEDLRAELRELQKGEADRAGRLAEREISLQRLQASLTLVPGAARHQLDADTRQARQEAQREAQQVANARITAVEQRCREEVAQMEAPLSVARRECAALGRKCHAEREARMRLEETVRLWWQQAEVAEAAAVRHAQEGTQLRAMAQAQEIKAETMMARNMQLEARLDRVGKLHGESVEQGRHLRDWVVNSMEEVNRSAHGPRDPFAPDDRGFAGRNWTEILDDFRANHQVRIGHGCRTR